MNKENTGTLYMCIWMSFFALLCISVCPAQTTDSTLSAGTQAGAAPLEQTGSSGEGIPDSAAQGVGDTARASTADSAASGNLTDSVVVPVWRYPFLTIGAGMELGSMPLFDLWKRGLPDSVKRQTVIDSTVVTIGAPLSIKQPVSLYNISFHLLSATWVPSTTGGSHWEYATSLIYTSKSSLAVLESRTNRILGEWRNSLTLLEWNIGFQRNTVVDPRYFTITDADQVSFLWGARVFPLITALQKERVRPANISTATTYFGTGFSWLFGFSILRMLVSRNAVNWGIVYTGSWEGKFKAAGKTAYERMLNPKNGNATKEIASLSHKIQLFVKIAVGKKRTEPPAAGSAVK